MTVVPFFRNKSLAKNILLGSFLTDESFALSMNKINYIDHGWGFASLASALAGAFDKSTQVRFEVYTGSNVRRLALPSNNR
ncbi:hypothetical protein FD46_GL001555 [Liquorilactobacillus oeni DSM 19972]|uniref:Uncharacterized protein n=1 Tax=Liquorilactobacillus oeni DSM 19972 TaxID=1423777 RepID=A0A0R1MH64_9LACO|nr:hypothetical protein FD46_GL001555 [Liquorilactobacillus oeni DSM 19972]